MRSVAMSFLGFSSSVDLAGEPPPESFNPPPDTVVGDKGDGLEVDVDPGLPTSTSFSLVGPSFEPSGATPRKRAAFFTSLKFLG